MKIGFIGLGIMGRPMARHLLKGGHDLLVLQHRSPLPADLIEGGALVCASPKEVAQRSNLVITMLPDTPDVERVLLGDDGVAAGLSAGKIVMDMSSIDPIATRRFAQHVRSLQGDYVDAPVSGGEIAAKAGTLTIMVGASDLSFARVQPVLEQMGATITHVGDAGDGQVAKVANQIIVGNAIAAVAEALHFAELAGANPAKVREALMGGFASSRVLEVHGKRMIEDSFDPGFRIQLHSKDLRLASNAGDGLGATLPVTRACQELMKMAIAAGDGDRDHSALIRIYRSISKAKHKEPERA